jgi:23S rRNA pseudouridine1911/1915/1917 synthase
LLFAVRKNGEVSAVQADAATFIASNLAGPTRLDRVLRERFPRWGRQAVQRLIGAGKVTLQGKVVRLASWEVHNGDRLVVRDVPAEKTEPPARFDDRWIIAEESDLVAINKPAGLLSEPTRFSPAASLLSLARERFGELVLFHRLDRDTSGVVLLTRPGPINKYLAEAFQSRAVEKQYLAVVAAPNGLQSEGVIDVPLGAHPTRRDRRAVVAKGGQRAVTRYAIEQERGGRQLVRLWPETGRTHQLRLHLAHLGAPILGDRLYGTAGERLLLHAERIALPAAEGFAARTFYAPLPAGFWQA